MGNHSKSITAVVDKPPLRLRWDLWEPLFRVFILTVGVLTLALAIKEDLIFGWDTGPIAGSGIQPVRYILLVSSLIFAISVVFRTYLWFKYRTFDSARVETWPEVTVIIPAYNEGQTVYETVASVVENDYPAEKIQIILVDDGSSDDTHRYMTLAREHHSQNVEILRFPVNRGKRVAIHEAYKVSRAPFIITIDSDTRLDPRAIKEILTPMLLNPHIGAAVGRIRVWNTDHNILTRMLNAHFAMAFDFTRAVQSTFQNVFCLAGAFSAYRKSVLDQIISRWLGQTFMKRSCTYGEDRSLTNHILRIGHGTYFQRSATAYTMVPTRLLKILKMFTRWARSNIRESIVFSQFLFAPNRKGQRLLPFIEFFSTYALLVLHIIGFYWLLFSGVISGDMIFRVLIYSILFGFFYSLYYLRIEGGRDFPYLLLFSLFSSVFMVWIFTVAGLTLSKRSWSTR